MQILVIAAFVALFLHDALAEPLAPGFGDHPGLVASLTLSGLLLCWVLPSARIAALIRRMDRAGSHRDVFAAERWAGRGRLAATVVFALGVLGLGWLGVVRRVVGDWILLDELIVLAPLVGVYIGLWWSIYPVERRLREAVIIRHLDEGRPLPRLVSRGRFVVMSARNHLLLALVPLLLIMAWIEALVWVDLHGPGWVDRIPAPGAVFNGLTFLGVAAMFTLAPSLIRRLWETESLAPGPLRDHLSSMCDHHGVRVRDVLVWRTDGLSVNAAVMGVIGRFRYILMTDGLLEQLERDEIEAVAAHEIAHVRRRHIPWLAAGILGVVLSASVVGGWLVEWALGPEALDALPGLAVGGTALAGGLILFGFASRRFEWQADAFAAQHLSGFHTAPGERPCPVAITERAADAMSRALRRVAVLNGISPERGSWRHGSIALRRRRLADLVGRSAERLPIDRTVRRLKLACLGAAILAAGAITLDVVRAGDDHRRPDSVASRGP